MITKLVADLGAEAIEFYAQSPSFKDDWEIPESFVRSFVERRINETGKFIAVAEQSFWQSAHDLRHQKAIDLARTQWNGNADLTIYQDQVPIALVELKKLKDGFRSSVAQDAHETLDKFTSAARLEGYLGVFVMDTYHNKIEKTAEEWITELTDVLGCPHVGSGRKTAKSNDWGWQFVCWGPLPQRES